MRVIESDIFGREILTYKDVPCAERVISPSKGLYKNDISLFCDIYNVFFMFLIDFFVLNSNPMSASLESLSIFVYSRSKVNFKVK